MKEYKPENCLDCPFVRIQDKYGDAICWWYEKSMVAKAEQRPPDFCRLETVVVNEKAEEPEKIKMIKVEIEEKDYTSSSDKSEMTTFTLRTLPKTKDEIEEHGKKLEEFCDAYLAATREYYYAPFLLGVQAVTEKGVTKSYFLEVTQLSGIKSGTKDNMKKLASEIGIEIIEKKK